MHRYSHLFSTLHDERSPIGHLGRGAHYSVLRAVVWDKEPTPRYHDFAVVWDEDHDERIIWIVEQLYIRRLLPEVLAIGECKGHVTALAVENASASLRTVLEELAPQNPDDPFTSEVGRFHEDAGFLISDSPERVRAYLHGIDALWQLGRGKPLHIGPEPKLDLAAFFRAPPASRP